MRTFISGLLQPPFVLMLLLIVDYVVWSLLQHLVQRLTHYYGVDVSLLSLLLPILLSLWIVLWIASILMSHQRLLPTSVVENRRLILNGPLTLHLAVLWLEVRVTLLDPVLRHPICHVDRCLFIICRVYMSKLFHMHKVIRLLGEVGNRASHCHVVQVMGVLKLLLILLTFYIVDMSVLKILGTAAIFFYYLVEIKALVMVLIDFLDFVV